MSSNMIFSDSLHSRKHFSEKQAERWWKENETRIYTKYNVEQILTSGRNRTVR